MGRIDGCLLVPAVVRQRTEQFSRAGRGSTYSAMTASIMVVLGLPITVGVRFEANIRGADMAPLPGNTVPFVGKLASWLVKRKWQSLLSRRWAKALQYFL
jgi:hypothetical protein